MLTPAPDGLSVFADGRITPCPPGSTADGVVDALVAAYRQAFKADAKVNGHDDEKAEDFAGDWPDQVVMRGLAVLAVVRPRANGQAHVCRFDGLHPRPFEHHESAATPDFFDHPTRPGHERHALRSFRVTAENGRLETVHEGRGLTLAEVIRWETGWFDNGEPFEVFPAYDITVIHDRKVVAVLRNTGDGRGTVKVLSVGTRRAKGPKPTVEVDRD